MNQYGLRGDFKGFTFNKIHSSTLGLTRVSDGNRYADNITPTVSDTTIDITGASGKQFFGSVFTKRDIPVSFVFDDLTDAQLKYIRKTWNDKQIHALIFDEAPYKVYSAKVTGTSVMKFVAFDDGVTHYRGEGSLTFTCYFPYARSRYLYQEFYTVDNVHEWVADEDFYVLLQDAGLSGIAVGSSSVYYDFDVAEFSGGAWGTAEDFEWVTPQSILTSVTNDDWDTTMNSQLTLTPLQESSYVNKTQWMDISRIPKRDDGYGTYDRSNGQIQFFNAGDLPMPTRWWYRLPQNKTSFTISTADSWVQLLNVEPLKGRSEVGAGSDSYIVVDMANGHVEGYDSYMRRTGRLYDQFLSIDSQFFLLPQGEVTITSSTEPYQIDAYYLYL